MPDRPPRPYLPEFIRRKLQGRDALATVLSNTGWLMADSILRMGAGLLVNAWVTRYLGPEQFGLLSYATTFVMLFASLALLGLDFIVVRNIVRDPHCREETLGTALVLKLFAGAGACFLTVAAIALAHPADHLTRLLVGISAIGTIFQAFGTFEFWFQSQVQSKYAAAARSMACLVICGVKLALVAHKAPLTAFAWAGLADMVLVSVGMMLAYRLTGHRLRELRPTLAMARSLLRDSWPLIFTDLVILVYMRADRILVGELAGNRELGIYAVAALLAEALYFIPTAVTSSLYPAIVAAKEISEELFHERLQKLYNLMVLLAYAVALPVTLLAGWLVPLVFGGSYAPAAGMLIGLVWAGVFINLSMARNYYLTTMNWTRLHFVTDFLGCLVNLSLNCYLIPRYGGFGAVFASLVSYWFAVHGTCFLFRPLRPTGVMLTRALVFPKAW